VSLIIFYYKSQTVQIDANFGLIAIVIAITSSIAITGSFLLNWYQNKKQTDQRYTELLINMQKDLEVLDSKTQDSKNEVDFWDRYVEYLNKMEQIAHLSLSKRIPNDIAKFFGDDFQDAHYSIVWFNNKKNLDDNVVRGFFGYIQEWYIANENDLLRDGALDDVKSKFKKNKWLPGAIELYKELLEKTKSENK